MKSKLFSVKVVLANKEEKEYVLIEQNMLECINIMKKLVNFDNILAYNISTIHNEK